MQYSVELRNAKAAQLEIIAGASPRLKIRTTALPANAAAADAGVALADVTLPADWLSAPADGVVSKTGTWTDLAADANGTAGHWRLYKADGVTCVAQGTVGTSGADMNLLTLTFVAGQPFTIDSWQVTEGNA